MKKVLVIEDEEVLSKMLKEELSDAGYEVTTAFDGVQGLATIKNDRPDLVLLDILLPQKDGLSVLKDIKNDPVLSKIPVIILTNTKDGNTVAEAIQHGAFDYLIKADWSVKDLVEKIAQKISKLN